MQTEPVEPQPRTQAASAGGTLYDAFYYAHYCGERAYERDPRWLAFFGSVAEQIAARIAPASVLDAGCAMGMVVESLRDRGVEAYGVDISEYAIANVREDIRPYCQVGSILQPFPRRYDLIICIEVLEHLAARDAERAVANIVAHTDDVLFSSSPKDFKETTHFNVQPPEWWAELFARHNFYRDVGFDASFVTPWAVRFRRLKGPVARVVADYERRLWWLDQDNRAQRELGLEQRNRLAEKEAAYATLEARAKDLEAALARAAEQVTGREDAASLLAATELERDELQAALGVERAAREAAEYSAQLDAMRRTVEAHVPTASTVVVVSGGDDAAVTFPGRDGWHFPRTPEGWHAGAHPADGDEAAAHLESLRVAGAGWIVFPGTALWWLDAYPQFRQHLERNYRLADRSAGGVLYDLRRRVVVYRAPAPAPATPAVPSSGGGAGAAGRRVSVRMLPERFGTHPHSSTYVRLLLPLRHPSVERHFDVTRGEVYDKADVVFVERTWTANPDAAQRLVDRARADGARILFSIDDNLLDLNKDWLTTAHLAVVKLLAAEADAVVVSTEPLAERMAPFNDRIVVIPNALDERLLDDAVVPERKPEPGAPAAPGAIPRRLTLGYMGTSTHDEDLEMIAPALRNVLARFGDGVEFQVVGAVARPSTLAALEGLPVSVLRAGDGIEYPQFMRWMFRNLHWDAAIAPLRDDVFNRCKSDIKLLDYGALGIPAVFSRVPSYEHSVRHGVTGLLAENTVESWAQNLERLLGDDVLRRAIAANVRRYVLSERTLRRCAGQWRGAINGVMQKPPRRARGLPAPAGAVAPPAPERAPALPSTESPTRGANAVGPGLRALVVVPDDVNYFYAQTGRRLGEALRAVGVAADVRTLKAVPRHQSFDLCVMVNLYELAYGYGDEAAGYERLEQLAADSGRSIAVAMDCAQTQWFAQACDLCEKVGVGTLLDLGLHDQSAIAPPRARRLYQFAFNGLNTAERDAVRRWAGRNEGRPLPWVFVGHVSAERAQLVRRLVSEVDPAGFVYMPHLAPYREKGPHLNESQLQSLLERARFHVWCSHHPHFYMESERFRNAALAGCLPLKVVRNAPDEPAPLPFAHLVVREEEMVARLRSADFRREWARFADAFLALPSLEQVIADLVQHVSPAQAGFSARAPALAGVG